MRDVTSAGDANSATRSGAAAKLVAGDTTGRLDRFRSLVAGSAFSTNVGTDKLDAYDQAGEIVDTRRCHIHNAGGNKASGLASFAMIQGANLVRREGFEDIWAGGRAFVYGAVNAGNAGADYGPICLVADPASSPVPPQALAVFPDDSLRTYTTVSGDVDEPAAVADATAWRDRADLAVAQRHKEALTTDERRWPDVVCGPDRYLEVVWAPVPLSCVAEIRVHGLYRRRLRRLRARAVAGLSLPGVAAHEAAAYDVLSRWRRSYGMTIREVP